MYAKADLGSTTCEVVAFFDDEDELHNVVEELQIVGFGTTPKCLSCHHGKWSKK